MSIPFCGLGRNGGPALETTAERIVRPFNTIPEAQEVLRASRATVYRLVGSGDLELVKLGTKSLITGRSLERLIARLLGEDA